MYHQNTFSMVNDNDFFFATVANEVILDTDKDDLFIPAAGGSDSFKVYCSTYWYVDSKPSWVYIGTESGYGNNTIAVLVSSNNTGALRAGAIVIKAGGKTKEVDVLQDEV